MTRTVIVTDEARRNADSIYDWIAERSPEGAMRWYRAYRAALTKLEQHADRYAIAPEAVTVREEIRHAFFRTRKGNRHRIVFKIVGSEVHVLYVRGFGQQHVG